MTPGRAKSARLQIIAIALTIALSAVLCGCSTNREQATFANPIVSVGQDPFMMKWQDRYLRIEQRNDNEIWIRESKPGHLTGIASRGSSHRVWTTPANGSHCTDVWAPELHHIGTRWYIYYSATTCDGDNAHHRNFVLESATANPLGQYVDRGQLGGTGDSWAIDGTQFVWHDHRYFVWSGWPDTSGSEQDLFIARMTSPTAIGMVRATLSRPTLPWERHGAPIEEGPEALSHDGQQFVVYSASGSWTDDYCYGLRRLTGPNPLNPADWSKSRSAVFATGHGVYGPGHGSFVTSPDGTEYWMIYHSAIAEGLRVGSRD